MPVGTLDDLEAVGSPLDDLEAVGPAPGQKSLVESMAQLPKPPELPVSPAAGLSLTPSQYAQFPEMSPEQTERFLGPKGVLGPPEEFGAFLGGAGKATVADVAAGLRALRTGPREAAAFSGNIPAFFADEQMPVDVALRSAAEEAKFRGQKPVAATVGHVATGLAETLPLLIGGMELPAVGQKILGTAFVTNMLLRDAPEVAKALGDELGKPPEQRDPDRVAELYAQAIQIVGFTGLSGAAAKRMGRNIALVPRDAYAILERQTRAGMLAEPLPTAPTRELGVRIPSEVAMGPMFSPEAQRLAGEALRERVQPGVTVPGQVPAIELLRREVEGLTPVTRALAERPGGGPAIGGQIAFAGRAAAEAIPSARQAALIDTIQSTASLPQPPNIVQQIMSVVNNKDRLSLEQMRAEISRTGVGVGTRSQANDMLRVIDQRLEELRTDKPNRENEAIRQIIQQRTAPPPERPLPTVEVHPTPSGLELPGGGRVTPQFGVRPGTGKNIGRFEVEGLGTFPTREGAQAFADRITQAGVTRDAALDAYRTGGRFAVEQLISRAEGRPTGVVSGTAAEAWADNILKGGGVHAGPDVLAAYAVKGAALIERGIRSFAEWSAEMVKQFGEAVRPHLQRLWGDSNDYIKKGVPDAIHEKATRPVRDLRDASREGIQQVPAEGRGAAAYEGRGEARPEAAIPQAERTLIAPEPTPEQLATTKFVSKGVTRPSLGPEYYRAAGDAVATPEFWVNLMRRLTKGDLYAQESVYQAGVFLRQLGLEKAQPVIEALQNARARIIEVGDRIREQIQGEPDPAKKMQLLQSEDFGLGSTVQFPREIIESAFDTGSAKGVIPESVARPLGELTVEGVTALEPATGVPLSATDALINKLEALKLPERGTGRLYSLPHPDAVRAIGRTAWNQAIDVAIAAVRAGRAIGEAVSEAVKHLRRNVSDFNEQQIRANLDYVIRGETGALPGAAAPPKRPVRPGLADVYNRFIPEKPVRPSITERLDATWEALRTGFSSKFRPLDRLAADIAKTYGGTKQAIAHIFEQLKGSSGKAEADIYRFDQDVTKLVGHDTAHFNAYMFLRRSLDRLNRDLTDIQTAVAGGEVRKIGRRAVSDYTIPELEAKLRTLRQSLTPEQWGRIEQAARLYQQHMDAALQLQVASGRMSPELYAGIKAQNDFYAPFKLLKYFDETSRSPGTGRTIDTMAQYTKAMEGIEDPKFKLGDMLGAARQNIAISRVLAEKNFAMQKFASVADLDTRGVFVRKLGPGEEAPRGMQSVNVIRGGKAERFAVNPGVAEAVKLYNNPSNEVLSRWLRLAAIPFRAGATTANVAFQAVNLLLADLPRSAMMIKTGMGGPYGLLTQPGKFFKTYAVDMVRFPVHFVQSFLDAMESNLVRKDTKMALDYLDSGAAGAIIQDYLTPDLLRWRQTAGRSLPSRLMHSVIAKPAEFAKAIEEANKILGMRRAKYFYGVESGKEMAAQIPEAVTEIRRFSGSPDFGRMGKYTEAARLNLLFMFFNARIQGAVADIGRLVGRDGADQAATTWFRVIAGVGIPTMGLYYLNQLPQYKADYDARPQNEKDNYWLIPKDNYITDDQGNKMRDFWRIPKRDIVQVIANMTESAMKFAQERNPQAFWGFSVDSMENLSPLNIRGDTAQERLESISSSLNPILKTPLEVGTGRDTFRHRDIVPDTMKKATPELQYLDRTPTLYRKLAAVMPDVAPEALRSPLMLENITQNATAGLIQQFLPSREIPGRTGIETFPLLRRFQAAPYAENPQEMQAIKALQREAADEFLTKDRAARTMIRGQTNIVDIAKAVAAKYGMTENADAIFERATDLWLAEKNGINRLERQVLALPTDQRAKWIVNKLKPLDAQAKIELLIDYERKRILTESVMNSMVEQMGVQTPTPPPTNP